jgi:ABC-type transporter Mla subunit MlaD
LVGLIGAFLVARPIPWLFRLGTGIETDESRRTLTETVERLTEDMRGLSKASRTFAAHLKIDAANNIFARLDRQEHTLENIEKTLGTMAKTIETIPPALENSNAELQKIDALESALNSLLETSRENLRQQQASAEIQQKTNQTLEQILASQTSQNDNTRQALTEMVTIAKASREQLKNSQQKLRQALAVYAADSD